MKMMKNGRKHAAGVVFVLVSFAVPSLGEGTAKAKTDENPITVYLQLVTADAYVLPRDLSTVSLTAYYRFKKEGMLRLQSGLPVKILGFEKQGISLAIAPPYDELAKINLSREEIDKELLVLQLEQSTEFAYKGSLSLDIDDLRARDCVPPLEMAVTRVKKTVAFPVKLRLLSGRTGKSVPNYRIRADRGRYRTDKNGLVEVSVLDLQAGLSVSPSLFEDSSIETLKPTRIEPEAIQKALKEGKPIEVVTRVPRIVGQIISKPDTPMEGIDGYVLIRHVLGEEHTFVFRCQVRDGVFYIYGDESKRIEPRQTGTIAFLGDAAGKRFMLKGETEYTLPEKGVWTLKVPVVRKKDTAVSIKVTDYSTGKPISNASVNIADQDTGRETQTSDAGSAVLEKVPLGSYRLQVKAAGYAPFMSTINLLEASTIEVKLRFLCDVPVAIPPGEASEKAVVVIVPVERLQQREYAEVVTANTREAVIAKVPECNAAALLLVTADEVVLDVQDVQVARGKKLRINKNEMIPVSLVVKSGKHPGRPLGIAILDKATMMPMQKTPATGVFSRHLLRRQYLVFAVDMRKWVPVDALDLRKQSPGVEVKREFTLPNDAEPLDPDGIIGNRNWKSAR
jgi:hypothetical protein